MKIWKKIAIIFVVCILVTIPIVILTINVDNKSISRYPLNSYVIKDNELIFDVYMQEKNYVTDTYNIELPKSLMISESDQISINPRLKNIFDDEREIQEIKNILINGRIVWSSTKNINPIKTKLNRESVEDIKNSIIRNPNLDQFAKEYFNSIRKTCKNVTEQQKQICNGKILLRAHTMSFEFLSKITELTKENK